MKKIIIPLAAVLISLLAFAACSGSKVKIEDIQTAYTGAGYTTSTPATAAGAASSFGAIKGTTVVSVYEFGKESDADAFVTVTNAAASATKAKVSKQNKVFVCVAIDIIAEANADAALKIFNNLF